MDPNSEKPIAEQLRDLLTDNAVRVIDLFRDWDDDRNGMIDKREFSKAMPALGFDAPRENVEVGTE